MAQLSLNCSIDTHASRSHTILLIIVIGKDIYSPNTSAYKFFSTSLIELRLVWWAWWSFINPLVGSFLPFPSEIKALTKNMYRYFNLDTAGYVSIMCSTVSTSPSQYILTLFYKSYFCQIVPVLGVRDPSRTLRLTE